MRLLAFQRQKFVARPSHCLVRGWSSGAQVEGLLTEVILVASEDVMLASWLLTLGEMSLITAAVGVTGVEAAWSFQSGSSAACGVLPESRWKVSPTT